MVGSGLLKAICAGVVSPFCSADRFQHAARAKRKGSAWLAKLALGLVGSGCETTRVATTSTKIFGRPYSTGEQVLCQLENGNRADDGCQEATLGPSVFSVLKRGTGPVSFWSCFSLLHSLFTSFDITRGTALRNVTLLPVHVAKNSTRYTVRKIFVGRKFCDTRVNHENYEKLINTPRK